MSFITPEHIYVVIENMLRLIWKEIRAIELPNPFPRMTFDEAISRYGSDKPDTRFGMELKDITASLKEGTNVEIFRKAIEKGDRIKALNMKNLADLNAKEAETLQHEAKKSGFGVTLP